MPLSGVAPSRQMPVTSRSVDGAIQRMRVNLSTFAGTSGHISLFMPGGSALRA